MEELHPQTAPGPEEQGMLTSACTGGNCVNVEEFPTGRLCLAITAAGRVLERIDVDPAELSVFITGAAAGVFNKYVQPPEGTTSAQ